MRQRNICYDAWTHFYTLEKVEELKAQGPKPPSTGAALLDEKAQKL